MHLEVAGAIRREDVEATLDVIRRWRRRWAELLLAASSSQGKSGVDSEGPERPAAAPSVARMFEEARERYRRVAGGASGPIGGDVGHGACD